MSETSDFKSATARKLRLQPLHLSSLPSHPTFPTTTTTTTAPSLRAFILEVLAEATSFSDSIVPTQFQKRGSPKASAPSTAKVQLLTSDLLAGEAWFARQSEHVDESAQGTASYGEFVEGLFDSHSVHEMEYTPDVFDARRVVSWEEEIKAVSEGEGWGEYQGVAMEIYEMAHNIPSPLQNRVFPTLLVRALCGSTSFVVAQIPVYIATHPAAFYSNGRHRIDGDTAQKKEKVTVAQYVSVERVKKVDGGKVWWEMATASDAGGNLPMALQKMGVPGAVVKDVGYFIGWTGKRRKEGV